MPGILTEIAALDQMLFGDRYYDQQSRPDVGFLPGEVVLIRGEPGSGKTTLALQICSGFLDSHLGESVNVMTLEEPKESMQQRCERYRFQAQGYHWLERREVEELVRDLRKELDSGPAGKDLKSSAAVVLTEAGLEASGLLPPGTAVTTAARAIGPLAAEGLVHGLFRRVFRRKTDQEGDPPRMILIDSLNALMNLLVKEFPEVSARLLFNTLCQVLRHYAMPRADSTQRTVHDEVPVPPVILIIGEYHFHGREADRYLPESFFCDAEIVLRPEPVRLPREANSATNITLGYDIAAIVDPESKHLESRSFCRVLKARSSPKQSRRCAYDIEIGQGFRFFETYPGDGKLMLFAENEQQRSAWDSFFERDLTDSYPALRYETFTMEGLETVYESSRRLLHVPLRTDMYLSSLDSYWVTGYRDYRLKTRINELLLQIIRSKRGNIDTWTLAPKTAVGGTDFRSPLATWVCLEYPGLLNDLVYCTMLRFERDLYLANSREIAEQPRPTRENSRQRLESLLEYYENAYQTRLEKLDSLKTEVRRRYAGLCQYLFNMDVDTLCADNGPLPKKHFRETLLRPLPRSRLTFYGQYSGDLLRMLVRDDMHQFEDGEDYWLSIPYDANIGILVGRIDLLEQKLADRDVLQRYEKIYQKLKNAESKLLETAKKKRVAEMLLPRRSSESVRRLRNAARRQWARCQRALQSGAPQLPSIEALRRGARLSWDQVISLSAAADLPIGVETRSFDTLMAFFLELIWNCGGRLEVNGRYEVQDLEANVLPILMAFHYFGAIFEFTKTPRDSTIDPFHFARRPDAAGTYGEWLFARFWYSTLVDALTATEEGVGVEQLKTGQARPVPRKRRKFVWRNKGDTRQNVEILKMPAGVDEAGHFTCCGDWSFGLLEGSENVALACDLVSNLMGAVKVTERGLRGACLPTVQQFYSSYRKEPCVPATIREDFGLPQMSFGELASTYFQFHPESDGEQGRKRSRRSTKTPHATSWSSPGIFRQFIFDYRHCARELYGELMSLKRTIGREETARGERTAADSDIVVNACICAIRGIEDLRGRYIFIRNAFRHDVAGLPFKSADRRKDYVRGNPRQKRLALNDKAFMIQGVQVPAFNLSRGGCATARLEFLRESDKVTIVIGETVCAGVVKWTNAEKMGISFNPSHEYGPYMQLLADLETSSPRKVKSD